MRLSPGTRLGPYEILSLIGVGGMGEVYRATDTNLGRQVAIKIVPDAFASDPERVVRFEREAKTLASLNHPNIAAVYGLERSGGTSALVMELVEGMTLADRMGRGLLPVDEALSIARQIAEALDAAHERGIVHRDLKPANVMVRGDGVVKILDFGLAKALDPDLSATDPSDLPTMTNEALTRAGVILGTAAYMSPEQARGQRVDKRTDVWAFGCVLYEMLTGRAAFARQTLADTLSAVIEIDPEWSVLPEAIPVALRRVLKRCLEKAPKRRLRDIGDARIELDAVDGSAAEASGGAAISPKTPGREYLAWSLAAVGLMALAASLLVSRQPSRPVTPPVARTAIALSAGEQVTSRAGDYPLAVSPDGLRFAYVADTGGQSQLYVRELSALEPTAIAGTASAQHPFFSPDGEWIGFFAGGALQRVAVKGGAPLRICGLSGLSLGGSWGPHGVIVFATRDGDLATVDVAGGTPKPLGGSGPASWPQILPDGKTVLFTIGGSAIATMPLDGGATRIIARMSDSKFDGPSVLGSGGSIAQVRHVPSGHLVYGQDPGIVRAVAFDLRTLTVVGSPVSMVDEVERASDGGAVYFAVSSTGSLLYKSRGSRHQLVWVERNGTETPVSPDRAPFRHPRLSPDGKRIAVVVYNETRRPFIWIYDVDRGTKIPLTVEGLEPVWSPDGTRLALGSEHGAIVDLPVDGTGGPRTLIAEGPVQWPTSWSGQQQLLFYRSASTGMELWVLPLGGTSAPRPLVRGPLSNFWGTFSPDGRWVAYVSTESGLAEVYVRRFPDLADKVALSDGGGTRPRWSRDGRELFYRQGDAMMAVSVDTSRAFTAGKPQRLFAGPYQGEGRDPAFDVTADGRRFLTIKSDPASTLQQLTVVQNWQEELKQRASARAK